MNPVELSLLLVLTSVGWFCVGMMLQMRRTQFWRIQWIHVEHALAILQSRAPRSVSDVEAEQMDSGLDSEKNRTTSETTQVVGGVVPEAGIEPATKGL